MRFVAEVSLSSSGSKSSVIPVDWSAELRQQEYHDDRRAIAKWTSYPPIHDHPIGKKQVNALALAIAHPGINASHTSSSHPTFPHHTPPLFNTFLWTRSPGRRRGIHCLGLNTLQRPGPFRYIHSLDHPLLFNLNRKHISRAPTFQCAIVYGNLLSLPRKWHRYRQEHLSRTKSKSKDYLSLCRCDPVAHNLTFIAPTDVKQSWHTVSIPQTQSTEKHVRERPPLLGRCPGRKQSQSLFVRQHTDLPYSANSRSMSSEQNPPFEPAVEDSRFVISYMHPHHKTIVN